MVYSDADSGVVFFADIQEGNQPGTDFLDLLRIFFIGIFLFLERACGICVIARIDAYSFGIKCSYFCYLRIEVHIGY